MDQSEVQAYHGVRPNPAELEELKAAIMLIMVDPELNVQHPASQYPNAPVIWGFNKNKLDNNTFYQVPFAKNLLMYIDDDIFSRIKTYGEITGHTPRGHAMDSAMRQLAQEGDVIPLLVLINDDNTLSLVPDQIAASPQFVGGGKRFYVTR